MFAFLYPSSRLFSISLFQMFPSVFIVWAMVRLDQRAVNRKQLAFSAIRLAFSATEGIHSSKRHALRRRRALKEGLHIIEWAGFVDPG
jgi:hypothetical protein